MPKYAVTYHYEYAKTIYIDAPNAKAAREEGKKPHARFGLRREEAALIDGPKIKSVRRLHPVDAATVELREKQAFEKQAQSRMDRTRHEVLERPSCSVCPRRSGCT